MSENYPVVKVRQSSAQPGSVALASDAENDTPFVQGQLVMIQNWEYEKYSWEGQWGEPQLGFMVSRANWLGSTVVMFCQDICRT